MRRPPHLVRAGEPPSPENLNGLILPLVSAFSDVRTEDIDPATAPFAPAKLECQKSRGVVVASKRDVFFPYHTAGDPPVLQVSNHFGSSLGGAPGDPTLIHRTVLRMRAPKVGEGIDPDGAGTVYPVTVDSVRVASKFGQMRGSTGGVNGFTVAVLHFYSQASIAGAYTPLGFLNLLTETIGDRPQTLAIGPLVLTGAIYLVGVLELQARNANPGGDLGVFNTVAPSDLDIQVQFTANHVEATAGNPIP